MLLSLLPVTAPISPTDIHLKAAVGYIELGLYPDGWEVLDRIPVHLQTMPEVLRLRLQCALGENKWDIVEVLALILRRGEGINRDAAADAFIKLAVEKLDGGDAEVAKHFTLLAIGAKPDSRVRILDHPRLATLL